MKYIELAFVVVCVVAILQALGRRLPVPMAVLQIAAGTKAGWLPCNLRTRRVARITATSWRNACFR